MERKVRLSIRVKIIAVISALVVLSLGLYLVVALNLFNKDKTAYVYETSLNTADSVATQVSGFLARILKDSLNIYNLVVDRDLQPDEERFPLTLEEAYPARKAAVKEAAAKMRKEAGEDADEEQAYTKYLAKHKKDGGKDAAFALGELAFKRREFEKAAGWYKQALAHDQKDLAAFAAYKYAWALASQGQGKAAAAQFARLFKKGSGASAPLLKAAPLDAARVFVDALDAKGAAAFLADVPGGAAALASAVKEIERLRTKGTDPTRKGATSLLESRRLLRSLFYGDPDLVEFSVYEKASGRPRRLLRLANKDYLQESNLKESYLSRVDSERPVDFTSVTPQKPLLQNSSLKGGMGLLTLVRQDPLTSRYLVVRFRLDRFLNIVTQNRVYQTYLINPSGEVYAHPDPARLVSDAAAPLEPYVLEVFKGGQRTGVREYTDKAGEGTIVAYADAGLFNLLVFSEIKTKKAFLAARELTVKSLYFGIFFIALAMIIGIFFARTLTGPIDKLFQGTKVIAGGNFKTRVLVEANDEIGILADSFNFMAGRIVGLLEQEKDKVRLEEELKVAKLVQDSFFPANRLSVSNLDIAAFYTPAAECGGDWWGCLRNGTKTLLMIGDATGHGVPAALITATAASCAVTVQEMGKVHADLLDSPARILNLLNKAVYATAQGKILMTFFVALIDSETMTVTYANASHNPPYLYKYRDKDPDKKDLKPLMDATSYRLGHKVETEYTDAKADLAPQDVLVFFTDGLVECTNREKEEYGNRKFIKSILKQAKAPTEEIRDGIINAAMEFYAGQPLADDLTMVVAKVLPQAAQAPAPVELEKSA